MRLVRAKLPGHLRDFYEKDPDYFRATEISEEGKIFLIWHKNPEARTRHGNPYTRARLAAAIFNKRYGEFDGTDYTLPNERVPKEHGHAGKPENWESC